MTLEQYLNPGEAIIWQQGKHPAVTATFVVVFVLGLLSLPVFWPLGLGLLAGVLGAGRPWAHTVYAVTNRRVLSVSGLLSRRLEELPLEHAVRIEVREPLHARLFGCGDLVFNPAQGTGTDIEVSSLSINFIHKPYDFRRCILEQRELLAQDGMRKALSLAAGLQDRAVQSLAAELQQGTPRAVPARVAAPPPLPVAEPAVWYYSRVGQRHGPVSAAELVRLGRSGALTPQDWVWKEGMREWAPAAQMKGLFSTGPLLGTGGPGT